MAKKRAVNDFVVWSLSVILAGVFLLTGVPKLFGWQPLVLEAAGMRDFPAWIRVIVGIVETVGAVSLLIPSTATFAALMLAALMVPATLTQFARDQGQMWVPIVLLATLVFVAWRRNVKYVSDSYHQFADVPHPLLHDGVIAGLIGAAVIAVWFFIVDAASGRPFFTPATLGHGLLDVLGKQPAQDDSMVIHVLAYTVFHFAAFMFVGLLTALIVFLAQHEPSILFGFLVLFVAFEVGFYGLVGLLSESTELREFAWYQVLIGNLLAAGAMGFYFYRTHKELGEQFKHSLDWDSDLVPPQYQADDDEEPATPARPAGEKAG
ncbi:MAG: DoxX family protein [Gemmatimonadaceae bacterium]